MMSRGPIWLVRHAPTEWTGRRWCGRSDPPLTPEGVSAAAALAAELAGRISGDAIVVTSPLRRARDTAGAVAAALGASVVVNPDLVEIDFGLADSLTWDELALAQPNLAEAILTDMEPDWPGGETVAEVARRARSAASHVLDLSGSRPVLVVSHGGLLVALAHELGMPRAPRLAPARALRLEPILVA
jgi:broad specificity phosphatase PhoE